MSDEPPARATATVDPQHPWPGLLAFEEHDRDFFFGRDAEADELLALVLNNRVTVLFGLSGLGKTSLLRAGLFPRLRERDYLPVHLRLDLHAAEPPGAQVLTALLAACTAAQVECPPPDAGESMWEYLHRADVEFWSPRNRLVTPVLVFDQFEEVFSRLGAGGADAARRGEVITAIADLSEGRVPAAVKQRLHEEPARSARLTFDSHRYHLLITLREDYLPNLEECVAEMPSTRRSRMRLRHMRGDTAARAVLDAGSPAGIVTGDVALGIVRFVGESAASAAAGGTVDDLLIEPALLSVVCRELNQQRLDKGAATIALSQLDTGEGILRKFYEDATRDSPESLRAALEQRFVTADGTREMVAYQTLAATPGVDDADIQRLIDRRIIRNEHREGRRLLELTHDRLAPIVRENRLRREQQQAHEAERRRHEEEQRQQLALVEARNARVFRRLTVGLAALSVALAVLLAGIMLQTRRATLAQAAATAAAERTARLERERSTLAEKQAALELEQRQLADRARVTADRLRTEAETSARTAKELAVRAERAAAAAKAERVRADAAREEADRQRALAEAALTDTKLALEESERERLRNVELQQENQQQTALVRSLTAAPPAGPDAPTPGPPAGARGLRVRAADVHGEPLDVPVTVRATNARTNAVAITATVPRGGTAVLSSSQLRPSDVLLVSLDAPGYRGIRQFVTLGGTEPTVNATLPIDAARARAQFPLFEALSAGAQRVLRGSANVEGFAGQSGAALYLSLPDAVRANLLNVLALMEVLPLPNAQTLLDAVRAFRRITAATVVADVDDSLRPSLRGGVESDVVRAVAGSLSNPPAGYLPGGSFKTMDRTINLHVTLYVPAAGQGRDLASFDVDALGALQQAFQTPRSDQPLHPYDVHQLIVYSLKLDPRYRVSP